MNDTDVGWQFDVASYYRTVMQSEILPDDNDAARHVQAEIQAFAQKKLGEMMGFSRSAEAAPAIRRPPAPVQRLTRTVAPVQRAAPPSRPPASPPRSPKPESAPLIKRPEVKKANNTIPVDGEVRQEGTKTFRFRWTPADPDQFPPDLATKALTMDVSLKEGLKVGEQYIMHPSEGEWYIVRRKNISRQTMSKDAAPWRQDLVEAAMTSKATSSSRNGLALVDSGAGLGVQRHNTLSPGDVAWSV